jgi:hypothetical protein
MLQPGSQDADHDNFTDRFEFENGTDPCTP